MIGDNNKDVENEVETEEEAVGEKVDREVGCNSFSRMFSDNIPIDKAML